MFKVGVNYSGATAGAMADAVPDAFAAGNRAGAQAWQTDLRELHFEEGAGRRYGYQPRKGSGEPPVVRGRPNPKYLWAKLRRRGHTRPLVDSGRSLEASRTSRIDATSKRARLVHPTLPRYFYQYNKLHGAPNKMDELGTILNAEADLLARAAIGAAMDVLSRARHRP